MKFMQAALDRRRLILTAVAMLSLIGLAAWFGMDRQEDPFFPHRYGNVQVSWPGAEPAEIERLVLDPLEEEIAGIEEVNDIRGRPCHHRGSIDGNPRHRAGSHRIGRPA